MITVEMIFKVLLGLSFLCDNALAANRIINAYRIRNTDGSISIPASTDISALEIETLSGVSANIQTQLNDIIDHTTTDIPEGLNLYYTSARFLSDFGSNFALKTTANLVEGSNLYYTTARFNTALSGKTTSDLAEGSNLYFTNARALTALGASAAKAFDYLLIGVGAASATNAVIIFKDGHEKSTQTTAPTATVNANAGTGAACTLSNGTDIGGKINLTTGSLLTPNAGVQCTITFNKSYNTAPICTMSPASGPAGTSAAGYFYATTTTTLTVNSNIVPLNGLTLNWFYRCIETQ